MPRSRSSTRTSTCATSSPRPACSRRSAWRARSSSVEERPVPPVEQQQEYLQRLAEIDTAVARARLEPAVVVERAAGLLAGRVGSRVDEAHSYLLHRATRRGSTVELLAAELLAALEGHGGAGRDGLDSAVAQAVRSPRRPARRKPRRSRPATEPVSDDWTRAAQAILNGLPDNHTVLLPVRGDAGEVVDYVVAAASPSMVDTSGRPGEQVVGQRISEAYPTVADTPVWHAGGRYWTTANRARSDRSGTSAPPGGPRPR